jgi:hypothetical protein
MGIPGSSEDLLSRALPAPLAIGRKAWLALAASEGVIRRPAGMRESAYLEAGGDIVWAADGGTVSHPRAIVLSGPVPSDWTGGRLSLQGLAPWTPALPSTVDGGLSALRGGARALSQAIVAAERPRGLGTLLAGSGPDFPLAGARPLAEALAEAVREGAVESVGRAAHALVGLGPGLTPSGDDYVAGMLFAMRLLAAADPSLAPREAAIRAAILRTVPGRTNRISAALLTDAAEGLGFARMHALCDALAAGQAAAALDAARQLSMIGHSSGWDLLTGLIAGIADLPRGGEARDA